MLTFTGLKGAGLPANVYIQQHCAFIVFDGRKPTVMCHSSITPSTAYPAMPATATSLLVLLLLQQRQYATLQRQYAQTMSSALVNPSSASCALHYIGYCISTSALAVLNTKRKVKQIQELHKLVVGFLARDSTLTVRMPNKPSIRWRSATALTSAAKVFWSRDSSRTTPGAKSMYRNEKVKETVCIKCLPAITEAVLAISIGESPSRYILEESRGAFWFYHGSVMGRLSSAVRATISPAPLKSSTLTYFVLEVREDKRWR